MGKYKYSVLTYIFNGYDIPRNISNMQEDVEYILVTDDKTMENTQWKIFYDEKLLNLSPFEKCYYVRFHPFEYIHSNIVVRIDGSVELFGDKLTTLVDYFKTNNYDFSMIVHPERYNIIDEYNIWVQLREYPQEKMDNVVSYIKNNLKYDTNNKLLLQENFVIERKCKITDEIDKKTYKALLEISKPIERIDQTITSIICSKYFSKTKFLPLSNDILTDNLVGKWLIHGSNAEIKNAKDAKFIKTGFINGKEVQLYPYIKNLCVLGVCKTELGLKIKEKMLSWLNDYYDVEIVETDGSQFEYPAIKRTIEKSIETNQPVLYIHTKGAVNQNEWQSRVRNMWKYEFTENKYAYFSKTCTNDLIVVTPFTSKYKETWFNAFVINTKAAKEIGKLELHLENRWYYEEFLINYDRIKTIGIIHNNVVSDSRHPNEQNCVFGQYMWHYLEEKYNYDDLSEDKINNNEEKNDIGIPKKIETPIAYQIKTAPINHANKIKEIHSTVSNKIKPQVKTRRIIRK